MNASTSSQPCTDPSTWRELRTSLIHTAAWIQRRIRHFLDPFGITPQQLHVLRILSTPDEQPVSTSDVREQMTYQMSDTSRIVDRLEEKGFVTKAPCSHDRRRLDIALTEAGETLLRNVDEHMTELDALCGELTDPEARKLIDLLACMRGESSEGPSNP